MTQGYMRVGIVNMNGKNLAALKMAINRHNGGRSSVVDDGADVYIIDMDVIGSAADLTSMLDRGFSNIIILALDTSEYSGYACIKKPATMETLFSCLDYMSSHLEKPREIAQVKSEKVVYSDIDSVKVEEYDQNTGLLCKLKTIMRDNESSDILYNGKLVIRVAEGVSYSRITEDSLKNVVLHGLDKWTVRACDDSIAVDYIWSKTLESLIWDLGLWGGECSRMPSGLKVDSATQLVHWPDFTRLSHHIDHIRMTALLSSTPISPRMLSKILKVDASIVIPFISAMDSIGLITQSPSDAHAQVNDIRNDDQVVDENARKVAKGGLLRKFLARLMGI